MLLLSICKLFLHFFYFIFTPPFLPFKAVLRGLNQFPHLSPSKSIQMHWAPLEWLGNGFPCFSCTFFPTFPIPFFLYWIYSPFFPVLDLLNLFSKITLHQLVVAYYMSCKVQSVVSLDHSNQG